MPSTLAWIDHQARYITASPSFLALLSRSADALHHQHLSDIHTPACAAQLQQQLTRARDTGESETTLALFQHDTLYRCKIHWVAPLEHFVIAVSPSPQTADERQQQLGRTTPLFKAALDEQITLAKRQGRQVALLSLEIMKLGWVEASYGAQASATVLSEVCERLSSSLREGDGLYRVDEETFVIQLNNISDSAAAVAVANRLLEKLFYGIRLERQALHLNVAVGVALAPSQASDAGELTGAAKQALQAVKRSNQSGVRLYDPARQRKALHLSDLSELLQPSFEHLSFRFRPLYGVRSHRMEAAQLIPMLRDTPCTGKDESQLQNLLSSDSLCQQYLAHMLNALQEPLTDLTHQKGFNGIIVRIPAMILEAPEFINHLRAHTQWPEAAKNLLFFEVDAVEIQEFEGLLFDLEALGFRIVINGFSEFQPSLQQIKELEPEMLKLEENLVQQMESHPQTRALLENITDMAHDLDIPLTADGVQSAGQRLQLAQQGVSLMQGDYFGGLLTNDLLIEQLILEKL
ncbi:EAL domain-containing protein [Neptunomonas marina]|uniref:EAL domain-containing protein n=1 Tax=Neptunomonas marina TaxID=1815562 RepID=A0A437QB61_9GAMM|nr:EAL domain-containing protein [Neptunomonas marina]RVU31705.1 EAL domain-containing protein [Neptunomonas marina]